MHGKPKMEFEIIIDTREQKEIFTFSSFPVKTKVKKLDTGDYSITGFEDKITIDRKRNAGELQMCFGQQWKRFQKELNRMRDFDKAYFICTFPYKDLITFPVNSGIPKYRWKFIKTCGAYLRMSYKKIEEDYPSIKFIFGDDYYNSEDLTYRILKNYYEKNIPT